VSVFAQQLRLSTHGDGHTIDITAAVQRAVEEAGIEQGLVSVFVPGSTAAITTMEYEPGGVHDLRSALGRLVPAEGDYEHNRLNHERTPTPTSGPRSSVRRRRFRSATGGSSSAPGSRSC
jgi:thiamine phosphate synthase YjbQ (UPF0047 family)